MQLAVLKLWPYNFGFKQKPLYFLLSGQLLWPPYVIGGPLYFCPVISIFYLLLFFLA